MLVCLDVRQRDREGAVCMEAGVGADELIQTLEDVRERIERYRDARIGEQNTKATLIVPVQTIEADGRVRVGGEVYNSLSIAGGAARVAVKGPPPDGRSYYQTNGWTFWEYADRDGKQQPMEALRKRYLSGRSSA